MQLNGISGEFAERVFNQISGFGEYGFPESHAASFALLVYVSAWLKHYHPAAFAAALINSQPMGFYAPAQLIQDARKHGVAVLTADVNYSDWDCTLEERAIRLGLRLVVGLQQSVVEAIVAARQGAKFQSLDDLVARAQLTQAQVSVLAEADVLRSFGKSRRDTLWNAMAFDARPQQRLLFDLLGDSDEPPATLPIMSPEEEVYADYHSIGMSLRSHPIAFQRERLSRLGVKSSSDLLRTPSNTWIRAAGIVLLRQRPSTSKGITFVTLEDETGTVNLILHQATWDYFRAITRHSQAWLVHGVLESRETVVHVIVRRVEDLAKRLKSLPVKSRDFR